MLLDYPDFKVSIMTIDTGTEDDMTDFIDQSQPNDYHMIECERGNFECLISHFSDDDWVDIIVNTNEISVLHSILAVVLTFYTNILSLS